MFWGICCIIFFPVGFFVTVIIYAAGQFFGELGWFRIPGSSAQNTSCGDSSLAIPVRGKIGLDSYNPIQESLYAKVLGIPYYLYTAYGRLLKYDPSTGEVSVISTDLPKDPHIP